MGIEIERKFLVDHARWDATPKPPGNLYKQGYVLHEANRTVRVRITGDAAYLTFKGATQGISRSEYEYQIPVNDGVDLLNSFTTSVVEKTRYIINHQGKRWEVDVFDGDNAGLIMAEIELQSEDEMFERPDWILREVSEDSRYYNSNLSVHPFKTW